MKMKGNKMHTINVIMSIMSTNPRRRFFSLSTTGTLRISIALKKNIISLQRHKQVVYSQKENIILYSRLWCMKAMWAFELQKYIFHNITTFQRSLRKTQLMQGSIFTQSYEHSSNHNQYKGYHAW